MTTPEAMIEKQLKPRGIHDRRVLEAMRSVLREEFVPAKLRDQAYEDHALAIGKDQTISQPYIVAYMTQMLQIRSADRVLEIGTGSGYQAAVLSLLAAEVFSVERLAGLSRAARARFERLGYQKIHCRHGDGALGWPEQAPFDKMIITAACSGIPPALLDQLSDEGGALIAPVGGGEEQKLLYLERHHGTFKTTETIAVRFVPLV